jgi:FAD/FMN-containing dehydrogenase
LAAADLDQLGATLEGDLFKPGDAGWDAARQAWNLVADQHPDAVALVSSPDDVVAAVSFARENGLGVVAQGTGHGAPSLESLEGVVLIKTQR